MPKLKPGRPKPPPGFAAVDEKLTEFDKDMKRAVAGTMEGKRKVESLWEVSRVNYARSRYVYNAYHSKQISKAVFEYCILNNWADGSLMQRWTVQGYENLCCLQCIQEKSQNFGGSCICRVPIAQRRVEHVRCRHCGCSGCASGDRVKKEALKQQYDEEMRALGIAPEEEAEEAAEDHAGVEQPAESATKGENSDE